MPKRRKAKPWNRCDCCGKFISIRAFEIGMAVRCMDTPDSHYTCETYVTLCPECRKDDDD